MTQKSKNSNLTPMKLSKQELIDENRYLREKLASVEADSTFRLNLHQTLSGAVNVGFWEWDELAGRPTYISREMADIVGMSQKSLYEKYQCQEDYFDLVHPDDLDHYRIKVEAILEPEFRDGRTHTFDYRIIRPDGEVRHILELGYGKLNEGGIVTRSYGAIMDIADQWKSVQAHDRE